MKHCATRDVLRYRPREHCGTTRSMSGQPLASLLQLTSSLWRQLARIQTCPEREKYVALILDEMHVKEELVYDKQTGMPTCVHVVVMYV